MCVCGGERKWCDENRRPAAISADRPQPRPLSRPRPPLPPSHPNARRSGDKRRTRPCRGGRERATRGPAPRVCSRGAQNGSRDPHRPLPSPLPLGPHTPSPPQTGPSKHGGPFFGWRGGVGPGSGGGTRGHARAKEMRFPPLPPPLLSLCAYRSSESAMSGLCAGRVRRGACLFLTGKKGKRFWSDAEKKKKHFQSSISAAPPPHPPPTQHSHTPAPLSKPKVSHPLPSGSRRFAAHAKFAGDRGTAKFWGQRLLATAPPLPTPRAHPPSPTTPPDTRTHTSDPGPRGASAAAARVF